MFCSSHISVAALSQLIGRPDAPVLVDVCLDEDFNADPRLIPAARRQPFDEVEHIVPELDDQQVVVICQKGLKLSQGTASLLRSRGIDARYLEGGVFAWRDAGKTMIPADKLPPRIKDATRWITSAHPSLDAMACTWLIRRFIDPTARLLFVETDAVSMVAAKFDGHVFANETSIPNQGGNRCTFDIMIEEFQLRLPALLRLAEIVRALKSKMSDEQLEAAGVAAALKGLSIMHRDDLARSEACFFLFDALYTWAGDATSARRENLEAA